MDRRAIAAVGRRRTRAKAAFDQANDAAKEAARQGAAAGVTEVDLKELLQVNRMTVRSWLGKQRAPSGTATADMAEA